MLHPQKQSFNKKKKKLLFVIESLALAGSEKSLISLLANIDPKEYSVDLQLFSFGGALEAQVPEFVNILPILPYDRFLNRGIIESLRHSNSKHLLGFIYSKTKFSLWLRMKRWNTTEKAMLYWKSARSSYHLKDEKYDVAIAFAQGLPTFYVADKIEANLKVTWVNGNILFTQRNLHFQKNYYNAFHKVIAVSEGTRKHMLDLIPSLGARISVIPDIVDTERIIEDSRSFNVDLPDNVFRILTVSRLDSDKKGVDIAADVCRLLREKGESFHWYFIGAGPYREEFEHFIQQNNLERFVTLLGTMDNPYPYFKGVDLYVQTSRSEGLGRTIIESKILRLPVVTTRFDTVSALIEHEKNGLITDIDAKSVMDAIVRIKNDNNLYNSIIDELKQEAKFDSKRITIELFDAMIKEGVM